MDNYYAIYTYKFNPTNDEGDWTQGEQVKEANTTQAQDVLYELFGKRNTIFHVQKDVKDGVKKYDCRVYGNDHRIVALRLVNEKEEYYYKEEPVPNDPMGMMKKKSIPSTPCTFVIIDCRPGRKIIAVKVENDAWRNTDIVRDLMEESINHHLESFSSGIRVQLLTKMQSREAFGYTRHRIKKEGRALRTMTIRLCHQVDKAMAKYIERKDREFVTEGGIRERMTAARLGQRETQRQTIERQAAEIATLRQEIARLRAMLEEAG